MARARVPLRALAFALASALVAGGAPAAPASDADKLEQLRGRLERLGAQQREATDQRGALTRDLKRDEQRVAAAAATLRDAERDLAEQQRALEALRRDQELQRRVLKRERATLAAQVRSAYVSGREERLKVLLNLEDPSRVGRVLEYYARFNAARSARARSTPLAGSIGARPAAASSVGATSASTPSSATRALRPT